MIEKSRSRDSALGMQKQTNKVVLIVDYIDFCQI